MTYSLNALNASASGKSSPRNAPPRYGIVRFSQEVLLLIGLLMLVFWLAAMITYSPLDPAFSTSGAGHQRFVNNWMGRVGAWLADACYFGFGMSVWWLVLAAVQVWLCSLLTWMRGGVQKDGQPITGLWQRRLRFWPGLVFLMVGSCVLEWTRLYSMEHYLPSHAGGVFGYSLGRHSALWLGFTGSGLIAICLFILGLAMVFRFSWGSLAEGLGSKIDGVVQFGRERREIAKDVSVGKKAARVRQDEVKEERTENDVVHPEPVHIVEPVLQDDFVKPPSSNFVPAPSSSSPSPAARVVKERQKPVFTECGDSKLPQVSLLDEAPQRQESVSADTLEMTSRLIEKRLKDFGVDVRVVAAMPGPVITRYEIEPATGVKGSQVVNLAKDLARSLSLVSIRVIETIPGKNFMALELPNAKRQSIRLSEVLGSQVYHDAKSMLTMGLGKDIVGNPVVADLAKMPHCLVAGTTGSGKSVGINAMILSLLYKAEARDVRLLMIDPKMLEMSVYEGIPHLLCPVVTDMKLAANGLNWCVAEMERRYKLMSKLGVRNLAGYNTKIDEAKAREESIPNPFSLTPEDPEPLQRLPHIVIVIDELADLMMVVGKKIEELIARLAQKARAAGIHLILATQRPSVDVITGLIKANIPTRIAFQVSSKIDSRTVLDQMGAESLLGMGDMLYMASGTGFPIRVHGAFVSDEEVHRVVSYLKEQGEADYIDGVLEVSTGDGDGEDGAEGSGGGEKDELYDQAVEIVLKDRKASISYVQRKLRIGYNRSANLLEQMEKSGLVSSLTSGGQREVLVAARPE